MNLPENLILFQKQLGPLDNFLYFIGDKRTNEIAVIDPAWDVDFLCDEINKNNYKVTAVYLTHAHPDHVNGLDEMLQRHDVPAYISKHEADFYKPQHKNIVEIDDGHTFKIGEIEFKAILAPGHSPGCQLFLHKNVMIAGDVIFIDGCGRCDLPGSDPEAMYHSLYDIVMKLSDDVQIFCGHNYGPRDYDTVGEQKKTNPYLNCSSKEEFLRERMGFVR